MREPFHVFIDANEYGSCNEGEVSFHYTARANALEWTATVFVTGESETCS